MVPARIGGGTGLIVRASFKINLLHSDEKSSFEYSEWLVAIDNLKVRLIIIYLPPNTEAHPVTTSTFFREFSDLLEDCVLCPEKLILTGDFNIHVDDHTSTDATKFTDIMNTFSLQQHVSIPTHDSGHTLDLIITRSTNDIVLSCPQAALKSV